MTAGEPTSAAPPASGAGARAVGPVGEALLARAAVLAATAARLRAGTDAEAVHDLRVAARRLEAALRLWRPAGHGRIARAARRARRDARRLRRAAGEARTLEVHVALLEERVAPFAGPARSAMQPLLEALRERRDRARLAVADLARPRLIERVADRVAAVAVALAPPSAAARLAEADQLAEADRRVGKVRAAAADQLAAAAGTTRDRPLHAARIALKKWRYAEESRAAARPRAAAAPAATLRAAQKSLGEVHDHAVLRDLLRGLARRGARAGERERARALAALRSQVERARLALLAGLPRRLRALATAARRPRR